MANNKRKRPSAQDWPPTSGERKALVPYGHRPKLPRMNKSPYIEMWLRVMSFVRKAEQKHLKRAIYFRDVHSELCKSVTKYASKRRNLDWPTPVSLALKKGIFRATRRCGLASFESSYRLEWIDETWASGDIKEILVWTENDHETMLTYNEITARKGRFITRFKKREHWEASVMSTVNAQYVCSQRHMKMKKCPFCEKRHQFMDHKHFVRLFLSMAPKSMDLFGPLSVLRKIYGKYDLEIED